MLDEDLGPVSTQFAFDHFRQQSEEKTTIGESSSFGHGREGYDVDSFEVVIFIDLKLRDILKNCTNSQGLDDEEDEPTISTDNYNITSCDDESKKTLQLSPSNLSKKINSVILVKKPEIIGDETNEENVVPNDNSQEEMENLSRIKKQISLYERDNSTELKKLSQDVENFTRRPGSGSIAKRWIDSTPQQTNYVSADNISNTSFYIDPSPMKDSNTDCSDPKTMSCMNLKSCAGPSVSPGAVVVKEKFIEPPVRVAKSFHGNTSFLKYKCKKSKKMDAGVSTDSVFPRPASSGDIKHRFRTTKVNEFDIHSDAAIEADNNCDRKT